MIVDVFSSLINHFVENLKIIFFLVLPVGGTTAVANKYCVMKGLIRMSHDIFHGKSSYSFLRTKIIGESEISCMWRSVYS